ncbi:PREDICTED: uncharacterized protein LOC104825396 [Tarenaya hassleriana]|uniref:uncharacterized protein LOC104825396 n=1 Tax=Tarenaya hassleriana TaxID=28532 RepID=UPI00053C1E48|nr:PREDICTED: uncharacterized protein LOC104825396 [Tarenaya hassleriana]
MANNGTGSVPNPSPSLRSIIEREKLNGANFLDWCHYLRIVLRSEDKEYILDESFVDEELPNNASRAVKDAYLKHKKDNRDLMFEEKARSERLKVMCGLLDYHKELAVDMVLHSLPDSFRHFVLNYYMNGMDKSLTELHGMLVSAEQNIKTDKSILVMQSEKSSRKRPRENGKGKELAKKAKVVVLPKSKPNKGECHYCHEGLQRSRTLARGEVNLRVGNGAKISTLCVGDYDLLLPS